MSEKRSLGEKNVTEGVFVLEHLEKITESFVKVIYYFVLAWLKELTEYIMMNLHSSAQAEMFSLSHLW